MMRWIVGSSLKFRRLVLAAAAGIMVLGVIQLGKTPVDVLPEFSPTMVEVQSEALGLSASEVEQLITVPLEQDLLSGVAFLEKIESASLPGLSSIVMTFQPGTPLLDARQVVQERLTQAHALPQVSKPPQMLQPLSSTSRVSMVRLSSEKLSPIEMSVLARWVIVPRLLGVEGVANVAIWGQRERQLQVQVDPARLLAEGVSLQEIISTTGNALEVSPLSYLEASTPGTGGFIETLNQRLQIFHEQAITSPQELAQVPLEDPDGKPVLVGGKPVTLGDVTRVVEDHQPLIGDALCQGGDKCILLVVEKFPGTNTIGVTEGVEGALDVLRPGLGDMTLDSSIYRPATFIESSFASLWRTLMLGAALVLLVIVVFFRSWRTALISSAVVALSLSAAGLVLHLRGVTVNHMVLAGLVMALGVLIDDAVGDVTNLARRMRQHRVDFPNAPVWQVAVEASIEMRRSLLYAGLIVAAALLPAFLMRNEGGAFLSPIALSYVLAVGVSMLVALTTTPALAMILLAKAPLGRPESKLVTRLEERYEGFARRYLPRAGGAVALVSVLLLVGLGAVATLGTSLRPALEERDLLIEVEAEPGTSLPKMRELVASAVEELGSLPGVSNVGAHVGRAVLSDQRVNVNSGEIWVSLDSRADRATVARIRSVMDSYEGMDDIVRTYADERVSALLPEQADGVAVRIYGENAEVRRAKAEEVRGALGAISGIEEPEVQLPREEPTVEVEVNLGKAQQIGIKPGDVRRTAATLLSGITVGLLFEDQKVFDVVVWGTPEIRRSVADVEALPIETPRGGTVRLGDVADVRIAPNAAVIRHESVFSYLDVTAAVRGRDVDAVAEDIEAAIKRIDFPLEHHAELIGDYADGRQARGRVVVGALAAALAVFLLLQAAFTSWRLAALAFVAIPAALVGGLVAVSVTGGTLTLGSIAGLAAVLGLTARHSVSLIRHYQDLERREGQPFGVDLVVWGTLDRLAPMVATTLGVVAIQLAFLYAGGGAGLEVVRPMAFAVLGGLFTSTALTLVLLPALYLRFGFVAEPDTSGEELFVFAVPQLDQPVSR